MYEGCRPQEHPKTYSLIIDEKDDNEGFGEKRICVMCKKKGLYVHSSSYRMLPSSFIEAQKSKNAAT